MTNSFKVNSRKTRSSMLWVLVSLLSLFTFTGSSQTYTVLKSFGPTTNVTGCYPLTSLVQGPDGSLYGTTSSGQGTLTGTVFKMKTNGTGFTVLKCFTNSLEGTSPWCSLVLSENTLYGTTSLGGSSGKGTVFKLNIDGTGYTVLKNFGGADGDNPRAGLTLSGTTLYGTTYSGGTSNWGAIYKLGTDGSGYTVLKNFIKGTAAGGVHPESRLIVSGNTLYGATTDRGGANYGSIFTLKTDGTGFTVLYNGSFQTCGDLILSNSVLYGCAIGGWDYGNVFKLNTDGSGYTTLHNFSGLDGQTPRAGLTLVDGVLFGTASAGGTFGMGVAFRLSTDGTSYTVIHNFSGTDGQNPYAPLILANGALYGTAHDGGNYSMGTVFKLATDGNEYAVIKHLEGDGQNPNSGLILANGVLYGTTYSGGNSNLGTVFKINPDGSGYTVLKRFEGNDGSNPYGPLVAAGNTLYGTTYYGGSSSYGTVFKINIDGSGFAVLKSFSGFDGRYPYAGLFLSDGTLYGTANSGGSSDCGVVFRINTDGWGYKVLHDFTFGSDGWGPKGGVVLSGSTLYGATTGGGSNGSSAYGTVYRLNTDGSGFTVILNNGRYSGYNLSSPLLVSSNTIFGASYKGGLKAYKINTDGTGCTDLYVFGYSSASWAPCTGLLLLGNTLYGVADQLGAANLGAVYKVNVDGTGKTLLKSFTRADGANPHGTLVSSGNTLYGMTTSGGELGLGVIYSLNLSPIVTVTNAGSSVHLSWSAASGATYQVQFKNSLNQTSWNNLGNPIIATNSTAIAYDPIGPDPQRMYRVLLQ